MQKNYLSLKNAFLLLMFFCLAPLVSAQNVQFASYRAPKITNKKVSFGHRKVDEKRSIDVVIIHSTYNASGQDSFNIEGVVEQFKKYGVSAHYVIDRKGNIFQLIDEKDISYHAGAGSLPDGRTNINLCSIGIEIVNTTNNGPNAVQYEVLTQLVADIKNRHQIKYVLGHSDIAPSRKTDPWRFDWDRFNTMMK